MSSVILLLCTDTDEAFSRLQFQRETMCRAVGLRETHNAKKVYAFVDPISDPQGICIWKGVACNAEHIFRSIRWFNQHYVELPYLFLRWFPNTVGKLLINDPKNPKKDIFEARFLPREATIIEITACYFRGTLEVAALPQKLHTLDLNSNKLHGTVDLCHLPPTIKMLTLSWNPFRMVFVDNDSLPKSLKSVKIDTKTKIGKYEANGNDIDSRIIIG